MGLYVQYGCGESCPEGWLNFDTSPTLRLQRMPIVGKFLQHGSIVFPEKVRYGDIVKGLPIPTGSADGVYASHVLEHLSLVDFWKALKNTLRMLKPGGLFRLVVPDLEGRARRYVEKLERGDVEANSWFMRNTCLGTESRRHGPEALARTIFGNSAHLWMWDETSMSAALRTIGFVDIRRCRFNDCRDQAFRLVEDAGRFYDSSAGLEECAMEARRPVA